MLGFYANIIPNHTNYQTAHLAPSFSGSPLQLPPQTTSQVLMSLIICYSITRLLYEKKNENYLPVFFLLANFIQQGTLYIHLYVFIHSYVSPDTFR